MTNSTESTTLPALPAADVDHSPTSTADGRRRPTDEFFVWSESCLVAVVHRRDGKTIGVTSLCGRD